MATLTQCVQMTKINDLPQHLIYRLYNMEPDAAIEAHTRRHNCTPAVAYVLRKTFSGKTMTRVWIPEEKKS